MIFLHSNSLSQQALEIKNVFLLANCHEIPSCCWEEECEIYVDHLARSYELLIRFAQKLSSESLAQDHPPPRQVRIHTNLSETSHVQQLNHHPEYQGLWSTSNQLNLGYFDTVRQKLCDVLAGAKVSLSILHEPFSATWLTRDVFCLNCLQDVFPSLLPTPSPPQITTHSNDLASWISSCLDDLHIKDSIFAIGSMSKEIASSIVEQSQTAPRRSSDRQAAVILVDRVRL
jgi:hypothetical protein